ncbi:MAG: triose-phosphate isomerase [Halioglobus sp.]
MRRPLVAGNWKMHGSQASARQLLTDLVGQPIAGEADVAVCPAYVHLAQAVNLTADASISVGAQDCSHMDSGAFTGEVSPPMLKDLGCEWVIIGHSERRQYHLESDELIAAKVKAAVAASLKPIVCVGETQQEREDGEAQTVVARQLTGALGVQPDLTGLVVAYEPVWAIGTGLTATPAEAQEMHSFIRGQLAAIAGAEPADTRILYGGSVKSSNAAQLFAQEDIDGALVGGAALDAGEFACIIAAAA